MISNKTPKIKPIRLDFTRAENPAIAQIVMTPFSEGEEELKYKVRLECAPGNQANPELFLKKYGMINAVLNQFAEERGLHVTPGYTPESQFYTLKFKASGADVKEFLDRLEKKQLFQSKRDLEILKTFAPPTSPGWEI